MLLLLLLVSSISSQAEYICRSADELRKSVVYCDENFAYYDAAEICKNKYLEHVKKEQKRIQMVIEAQAALASKNAQNKNFEKSSSVLTSAITDLTKLINTGKQVHTEIEDYVYDLILPAFDDAEAKADINDPKVKAKFRARECYGDPAIEMEKMEKELQVVIEDLERTKTKAESLRSLTGTNESGLDSLTDAPIKAAEVGPQSSDQKPKTNPAQRASDITGTEKLKKK